MSLKFGVTEARKMASAIDPEYDAWTKAVKGWKAQLKKLDEADETGRGEIQAEIDKLENLRAGAEEYALDALEAAMEIIESKAKFTVVGQLHYTTGNEYLKADDPRAEKVALGWYGTEKQALDDAIRLAYSTQTHEGFRAWVLPLHHGTPNDYFVGRKQEKKAAEADEGPYRERELARRVEWVADHPGEPLPEDWTVEIASQRDTEECVVCVGLGRVPKDHLTRRSELPASQKFY